LHETLLDGTDNRQGGAVLKPIVIIESPCVMRVYTFRSRVLRWVLMVLLRWKGLKFCVQLDVLLLASVSRRMSVWNLPASAMV